MCVNVVGDLILVKCRNCDKYVSQHTVYQARRCLWDLSI